VDEVVAEVEAAAARVEQMTRGLRPLPSPPPIARNTVDVKLPTPAGDGGKEQAPAVPELPLRYRITDAGLHRLREVCPGWDWQWLLLRYLELEGADKPGTENADASLAAWGRRFTKGKQP
jgi:hypothetical protein